MLNRSMRVAAASLNQRALDWPGNTERIVRAINLARANDVDLLCCPELSLTGYGCEDGFLAPHVLERALLELQKIINISVDLVVVLGLPIAFEGKRYNCAALISNAKLQALIPKQNLANEGVYYEPRWFTAWQPGAQAEIDIFESKIAFGDLTFELNGIRFGFEICEDAWVEQRPLEALASRGVELILNPSASHFALGKKKLRQALIDKAVHSGQAYVYANLLGCETGRLIYDNGSSITAPNTTARFAKRLSFAEVDLVCADLDFVATKIVTKSKAILIDNVDLKVRKSSLKNPQADTWENSEQLAFEEFTRAVALGLFDYMRKSYSSGFVISLSGGADSASVLVLVRYMLALAVRELGLEGFKSRLSYFAKIQDANTEVEIMQFLVRSVYQGTLNNTSKTRIAASNLARAVGCKHHEFEVDSIVAAYTDIIEQTEGRKLSWEKDDLVLQNIQARVRSPAVWMLANLQGALLLTTSNRSEASVGYASMDGDTSGGLAPIAGVDKHFLRSWLKWIETCGPDGLFAIPALKEINQLQPSAELRPGASQTDEKDLMPYEVLALLERIYLEQRLSPEAGEQQLIAKFAGKYAEEELTGWAKRFLKMWKVSQWKRERYAPSFHLDSFSVDPKSWLRYPIL